MKLQFALLAATCALISAKNIPTPNVSKNTQRKITNVGNKAANKASAALANYGVNVDFKSVASNMAKAGAPQGDAMQKEIGNKMSELSKQFGGMSLSDIKNSFSSKLNKEIDNAEKSSPDGVKGAMDIGQNFLNALFKAGGDAMGKNADLTLNDLAVGMSKATSKAMNGKAVHAAIKKANQNI